MNCSSCGAPLQWPPFSDVARCAHCGANHLVTASEQGIDRVVWSEEYAGDDCLRCDSGLVLATVDGFPAQSCPTCRGILLSNAAFGALVRRRRAEFRGADWVPQPIDLDQLTDPVYCPECGRTMEVHPYYGPGNQIIDSCARCGLVWIDSGELTAIERAAGRR